MGEDYVKHHLSAALSDHLTKNNYTSFLYIDQMYIIIFSDRLSINTFFFQKQVIISFADSQMGGNGSSPV